MIELLVVISLVALAAHRLRIPYTVALVVVGLALTLQPQIRVSLTPELILTLFVPPLVLEAAFHLELRRLRAGLVPVLALAVPGVHITLASGLVFGALIAATDPVAVVALFRSLGAPRQLTILVEGESLLNDGTSIVPFQMMLAAALPVAVSGQTRER